MGIDATALHQQIAMVQLRRENERIDKAALAEARAEWDRENRDLIDGAMISAAQTSLEEDHLRELTLAAYAETQDKKPAPGVAIRIRSVMKYDDGAAFEWAKAHGIALQLDVKRFEQHAKVDPPAFVTVEEVPIATIATDLASVLKEIPA